MDLVGERPGASGPGGLPFDTAAHLAVIGVIVRPGVGCPDGHELVFIVVLEGAQAVAGQIPVGVVEKGNVGGNGDGDGIGVDPAISVLGQGGVVGGGNQKTRGVAVNGGAGAVHGDVGGRHGGGYHGGQGAGIGIGSQFVEGVDAEVLRQGVVEAVGEVAA